MTGPRVTAINFAGRDALELRIVHKVGLVGVSTTVETRKVRGLPLASLPLTSVPRSRLEIVADGAVVFRRAFSSPVRDGWADFPVGYRQVLVTLVPDVPGADRILATGPAGLWLQHVLQ